MSVIERIPPSQNSGMLDIWHYLICCRKWQCNRGVPFNNMIAEDERNSVEHFNNCAYTFVQRWLPNWHITVKNNTHSLFSLLVENASTLWLSWLWMKYLNRGKQLLCYWLIAGCKLVLFLARFRPSWCLSMRVVITNSQCHTCWLL